MKKLFYFLLSLVAFVGCAESETDNTNNNQGGVNTEPPQTEFTVNVTDLLFDADSDVKAIDIYSTDTWSAEFVNDRVKDWCSISPTNGNAGNSSILVSVKENTTGEERSASIVVKSGHLQKKVKVTQKQNDALTVTSSKLEVKAEGGEVEIEVKANVDYDYLIDDSVKSWVKYKTTRAMETSTLVFDVAENEDNEKREAKITIHSGDISEVVTIYQEGAKPSIILTQNEYTVSDEGEIIAVEVKSGVDVGVEILDNVQWVSRVSSRAMSAMTYYFKVEQNDTHENREARIKFFNRENNLEEIVIINQMQKDAIVLAQSSYTIGSEGGKIDIEVGHNVDFDIQITGDWISNASTRAFENETLSFNIAANTAETSREGMIKFVVENGRITQTVTIVQEPKIVKPAEIRVKVTCDESTLHNIVVKGFGANVTSIKKNGEWYVITLAQGCTVIPEEAFYGCDILTSVTIPDGVTEIGNRAFCICSSLKSITIPDSVTSIGDGAFRGCYCLTSVTIPDGVTSIGTFTFYNCSSLTSVTIPDGVTSIGYNAFSICRWLKSITIPDSVTSIGYEAFYGCSSLTSVTIPDSVTEIGNRAFYGCHGLTAFYGKFASSDNRCLIVDGVLNSFAPAGLALYTIPDSVTSIGDSAFRGCHGLTSVTIPDGVTEIGNRAFEDCNGLKEVYCKPTTPPRLGYHVFDYDCIIYVPGGSFAAYEDDYSWKDYSLRGYYF